MKTWRDLTETEKQDLIDEGVLDVLFNEIGKSDVDEMVERWGEMSVAESAYAFETTQDQRFIEALETELESARAEDRAEETRSEHLAWRNR